MLLYHLIYFAKSCHLPLKILEFNKMRVLIRRNFYENVIEALVSQNKGKNKDISN